MPALILATRQTLLSLLLRTVPAGFTRPANLDNLELALFSVMPADDGSGYTEFATGGGYGYARKAIAVTDANFALAADIVSNVAEQKFATFTGTTPECVGWGIFDAGDVLRWAIPAGGTPYAMLASAAADTLALTGQPFADKQKVRVASLRGLPLPTNLAADTTYFVRDAAAGTIKLAATEDGAAIDIGADGAVEIRRWYGTAYGVDDVAVIPAGELKLQISA